MTVNKNSMILKVSLIIFVIVGIAYGLGLMFFPHSMMDMSGSEPIEPSWIRWSGGVLIALGIGAVRVLQNPTKQEIFVTAIAMATLFTGLALLYTLIFEIETVDSTWFTALPAIVNLVMSALLWWGRQRAKEILKQE